MSLHGSVVQEVRPGTARVKVTELGGCINPSPDPAKQREDSDTAEEVCISPLRLVSSMGG